MIAGIGGASLGTEICKSLQLAGTYTVFGCDIASSAFGHYDPGFSRTWLVDREDYIPSVLAACREAGARYLIPGGEQPNVLLGPAAETFAEAGIQVVTNDPQTVALFTDKAATFERLAEYGVQCPLTRSVEAASDVEAVGLPCIVKPATGSGGSASVFFAVTTEEAMIYADFIRRGGSVAVAQEYVTDDEGEFTIGVLSLPDGQVVGSIALKRILHAKLSVSYRGRGGLISSGYSQGEIDHFPELCEQAEAIAQAVDSRGPINIQGRVRDGRLLPFEINPRFSASTYLRAMAGFNEIDLFLRHLTTGDVPARPEIRPGLYLRTLAERFVPPEALR